MVDVTMKKMNVVQTNETADDLNWTKQTNKDGEAIRQYIATVGDGSYNSNLTIDFNVWATVGAYPTGDERNMKLDIMLDDDDS